MKKSAVRPACCNLMSNRPNDSSVQLHTEEIKLSKST